MELLTQAFLVAPAVVVAITELLKVVPVRFTSKYPAWVNAIVSVVAAVLVISPSFNFGDVLGTIGLALYIAVVAAIAYNQFVSKLLNSPSSSQVR